MPKISRLLFGNWLKPSHTFFDDKKNIMSAGYKDQNGNSHIRKVREIEKGWEIIDEIKGDFEFAESRWILKPRKWNVNKKSVSYRTTAIEFESNQNFELKLSESYESLHYMDKSIVPILEITFQINTMLKTNILFK